MLDSLWQFQGMMASDPKDKDYALMGLAEDASTYAGPERKTHGEKQTKSPLRRTRMEITQVQAIYRMHESMQLHTLPRL